MKNYYNNNHIKNQIALTDNIILKYELFYKFLALSSTLKIKQFY